MFRTIVMWSHLITAMFWIGGMLFFSLVLIPALKGSQNQREKTAMISRVGKRFRIYGWASLGILILTGLLRLHQNGIPLHSYGNTLKVKLVLVFLMLFLTLLHDFVLGPRSIALSRAGLTANAFQSAARWTARLNLLIGVSIVFAAVILVHGF